MMRTLIILAMVLSASIRGCAQVDSVEHNKGKNMKRYFDIKTFNENKDHAGFYEYETSRMLVKQYTWHDSNKGFTGYIEE